MRVRELRIASQMGVQAAAEGREVQDRAFEFPCDFDMSPMSKKGVYVDDIRRIREQQRRPVWRGVCGIWVA